MKLLSCDLLVIGLGPAGAAAAAAAARAGVSVIAADRKHALGEPVQCAEFIPLPIAAYAQAPGVLRQRVSGMRTFLPSGRCERSDFPGLMIDRAAFDRALAEAARAAGAELRLGTVLAGLEAGSVLLRDGGGSREVRFRALVAADGPHSPVARALGLPALATVNTRQYTVPLAAPHGDTDIWLADAYAGGYAWLFPKGEVANLGLGTDPRFAPDMKAPLDALHRHLVAEGRVGGRILARTGGAIPVGGLRDRIAVGSVLFAGDAAGLTHPITGAGIAPAVISGERAGQAVAAWLGGDAGALDDYEEDIRDQFEQSLERAVARRRRLEALWGRAAVRSDAPHRRGWIAFPEYFEQAA